MERSQERERKAVGGTVKIGKEKGVEGFCTHALSVLPVKL